MSVTLNGTLDALQDNLVRRPVISLQSSQFTDDIPFDGIYFQPARVITENYPDIKKMSDGRIAKVFAKGADETHDNEVLVLQFTDTEGVEWGSEYELLDTGVADGIQHCSVSPEKNGNIAVTYIRNTANTDLYTMVVDTNGDVVSGPTLIQSFPAASGEIRNVYSTMLQDESYMMAYEHEVSGEVSIHKRTSSDFVNWSADSNIPLSGLDAVRLKSNPSLVDTVSGGLVLAFDYVDDISPAGDETYYKNIYWARSTDGGGTWSAPSKITDISEFGEYVEHPSVALRADDTITLAYAYRNIVLRGDNTMSGWLESDSAFCGHAGVTDLHYDPDTGLLHVLSTNDYSGTKVLCSVQSIDVDTWSIEKSYTGDTSPAIDDVFLEQHIHWACHHGEGKYIPFGTVGVSGGLVVGVIDTDEESITNYVFRDWTEYSLDRNVEIDFEGVGGGTALHGTWVDADSQRLYCAFTRQYVWDSHFWFGYIDLTAVQDAASGMYPWKQLVHVHGGPETGSNMPEHAVMYWAEMCVDRKADLMCWSSQMPTPHSTWEGHLFVYQLSTGTMLKDYRESVYSGFHHMGCQYPIIYDGHIYAGIRYTDQKGQADRRGLIDVNLNTDAITYHRPTYATVDDYYLTQKVLTGDGRIKMVSYGWGITTFTISDQTWTLDNNGSLPGMTPTGDNRFRALDYDLDSDTVFVGVGYEINAGWQGVLAYPGGDSGLYSKPMYRTGTFSGGTWTWDAEATLVYANNDYDISITSDDDDSLWAAWTKDDSDEYSTKWDKEGKTMSNLEDYLVKGRSVTIEWSVDGLAQLNFAVGYGHRFDPNNELSSWNHVLKIGRRIVVQFGDLDGPDGTAYMQNQGTYIVRSAKMHYARGEYPILEVTAEDTRMLWEYKNITASEYYDDNTPVYMLNDLVTTYGGLGAGSVSLPAALEDTHTVEHQVIDTDLMSAIDDILEHWAYFARMTVDNEFTVTKFKITDYTVSNNYGSDAKIIEFSPNDEYASLVNRICVKGESRDFVEVVYEEECIYPLGGTVGWWGNKVDFQLWYSDDHERQVRDPRLKVIESVSEFEIFFIGGGGKEYLDESQEDEEELYCWLIIECPNLVPLFIGTVAGIVLIGKWALACDANGNCGKRMFALSLAMEILAYLLGAVANYQYELYGRPIGKEKQQVQYCVDDLDLQRDLDGLVIVQDIEDPFAYTVEIAKTVATNELNIARAQRNRVQFSKVTHLQDEIGDVIRVPHPYTKVAMDIFITNIRREFTPATPGANDGKFLDYIEGWRVDRL